MMILDYSSHGVQDGRDPCPEKLRKDPFSKSSNCVPKQLLRESGRERVPSLDTGSAYRSGPGACACPRTEKSKE